MKRRGKRKRKKSLMRVRKKEALWKMKRIKRMGKPKIYTIGTHVFVVELLAKFADKFLNDIIAF